MLHNEDKFLILLLAILIDVSLAEPPSFIHPTVYFGKTIEKLHRISTRYLKSGTSLFFAGLISTIFVLLIGIAISLIPNLPISMSRNYRASYLVEIILSAILLKTTFSIRSLESHVSKTATDDIELQRECTSMIVSRDVSHLSRWELCSASIESLAENIVDGVIAPIFYFILFGLPGAFAYRVINTCDAVVGYKNHPYLYFGKFSARLDDLLNYIPSRISILLFLPFSPIKVINHVRVAKFKINGDKPIACMSAVCNIRLEKKGYYSFPGKKPEINDILRAIKVFRVVVVEWVAISLTALIIWAHFFE